MELTPDYLNKFQVGKNTSEEKELCREIWEWSGKKLSFGMLIKMCRNNGVQCVREVFNETVKSSARDPIALFIWSIGKNARFSKKLIENHQWITLPLR